MNGRNIMEMDNGNARLLDTDSLRAYTSLGRDNAIKFGDSVGARVQVGRRVLWDREKIDAYLNELLEN